MAPIEADPEVAGTALACPACGQELVQLECPGCRRRFGSLAGIPDLRLEDVKYEIGEDLLAARELQAASEEGDFEGLLKVHWASTNRPAALSERFLAAELAAPGRSAAYLREIETARGKTLSTNDRFLEVGCGTAALAVAAAGRGAEVTAGDLSMRRLVLARKRLNEAGAAGALLICAAGERLPFPAGSFTVVAGADVIEHVADQELFVRECHRVLEPGGLLFLSTPNRFSLSLEPHVRLWGVGFLPHALAVRYVRRARPRGVPYDQVRLRSAAGLRRLLEPCGFEVDVVAPEVPPATAGIYSGLELRLVRAYNQFRHLPGARPLLRAVGPFFHVFARRRGGAV